MEFKFRAVDDRPTTSKTPLSGVGESSTQAPAVGYGEAVLHERAKERIREQFLAMEIAKRRVLEAEVHRELAVLEREMALTRRGPELEDEWVSMSFDGPRMPLSQPHPFDGHLPFQPRSASCHMFPLPPPRRPDAIPPDFTPSPYHHRVLAMAKRNSNLSGEKRKAVESPVVPFSLKKPKEEWSCAICRFSAKSEKKLNRHLKGNKHKMMEEEIRAQVKKRKNFDNLRLSKMRYKRRKLRKSNDSANLILDVEVEEESFLYNESCDDSEKISGENEKSKDAENTHKINGAEMVQKVEKMAEVKLNKKFKFWCELCQVGAHGEINMEDHKKGRRHMESLDAKNTNMKHDETWNGSEENEKKSGCINDVDFKSKELMMQKSNAENTHKINGAEIVQKVEKMAEVEPNKKFKFWCELCQVGAQSEIVMDDHKKGKNHMESFDAENANIKHDETGNGSGKKSGCINVMDFKSEELMMLKSKDEENMCKINGSEMVQKVEKMAEVKPDKKFKFWCELCQVGAHSEIVMEDHKKGKKHMESLDAENTKMKHDETWNGSEKKSGFTKDMDFKSEELMMQKSKDAENTNKINGAEMVQKVEKMAEVKNGKDLKFWCELCQVGVNSERVMEDHKKGKKHKESLKHDETRNCLENKDYMKNVEFKNGELALQKFQSSDNLNEIIGVELVGGEEQPAEHKNKKNFEFWCEICQVGAYCEIVMEDHKKGRRHMEALKHKDGLIENAKDVPQESKCNSEMLQTQEFPNSVMLNERTAGETVQGGEKKAEHNNRKNFNYWCEMCKVGAYCPVVMRNHEGGKKHLLRVRNLKENNASIP